MIEKLCAWEHWGRGEGGVEGGGGGNWVRKMVRTMFAVVQNITMSEGPFNIVCPSGRCTDKQ